MIKKKKELKIPSNSKKLDKKEAQIIKGGYKVHSNGPWNYMYEFNAAETRTIINSLATGAKVVSLKDLFNMPPVVGIALDVFSWQYDRLVAYNRNNSGVTIGWAISQYDGNYVGPIIQDNY